MNDLDDLRWRCSKKSGLPPNESPNGWFVCFMENPMNMDDDWGELYVRKPPKWYKLDWMVDITNLVNKTHCLVGGLNPSEEYESQLG